MVVGDDLLAIAILDPVKLEPRLTEKFAAKGYGLLDRREFEKVILALAGPGEQQQYKPYRLHREFPRLRLRPLIRRRLPQPICHFSSLRANIHIVPGAGRPQFAGKCEPRAPRLEPFSLRCYGPAPL